jgi:hypothetical protein
MSTEFLDRMAVQLKVDKTVACCRAIERILALIKKNFEAAKYSTQSEAENDFRRIVEEQERCRARRPRKAADADQPIQN